MKTLKYFVWNAIISGTLVAGHLLDWMDGTGFAIGLMYGVFLIPMYSLITLFSSTDVVKNALVKTKIVFKWTMLLEPVWIALAIYMGYKKIAVCMIAETLMLCYLCIVTYQAKKELPESEVKDDPI